MRIEQNLYIDKRVPRSDIYRAINNNMLPYKIRGSGEDMRSDHRDHNFHRIPPQHESNDSRVIGVDPSAFEKLVRRVDWLYEEVRYIRQSLESHQNHANSYEHHPSTYRSYEETYERRLSNQKVEVPSSSNRDIYYERSHGADSKGYIPSATLATTISTTRYPYAINTPAMTSDDRSVTHATRVPESQVKQEKDVHHQYEEDSPLSNTQQRTSTNKEINLPDDITIAEIVVLWERGINDIPSIVEWDSVEKAQHREKLEIFFKVHHIFRYMCNGDITQFVSLYTDSTTKHMQSPAYVASLCPDVRENFETFLQSGGKGNGSSGEGSLQEKVYTLPRKINGRKVSARDVIQLWEGGMGDVPPIKTWTKSQKFKQQSKISRWKKIVDIFKYQCNSDMRKFEEIYTDGHGCLLPVAAITNKFETLYGDELNITSKLMTVPTTNEAIKSPSHLSPRKRKITDESGSDDLDHHHREPAPTNGRMDETVNHHPPPSLPLQLSSHLSPPPPLLVSVGSPPKLVKSEDERQRSEEKVNGHFYTHTEKNNVKSYERTSPESSNCESEEINEDQTTPHLRRLSSIIYILPDSMSLREAITYWEKGSNEFPPVRTWTRTQNSIQMDLILKLERIFLIYSEQFHNDIDALLATALDEENHEIPIDRFLEKYQESGKNERPTNTSSMTFDFSHHKTISQSTDALYLLPRKINGRKVSAKDVLQLWYHGLNKIPPVKIWSPQQKAVQQSKISRWKKIVELFEQDFSGDWERFQKHYSNSLGQLLPITAIITKHEEESRTMTESGILQQH